MGEAQRPAASSHSQEAIALGADYLVVGRPITAAPDPREAAMRILAELGETNGGGRK